MDAYERQRISSGALRGEYAYPALLTGVPEQGAWYGCYQQLEREREQWMLPTPAGEVKHPARMGWVLAGRLVYEGQRRGWWGRGARIGCPMAGEGTELLAFRLAGCEVFGLEIEAAPPTTYFQRLQANLSHMDAVFEVRPDLIGNPPPYHVWAGDATQAWPGGMADLDAVVFSPTYEQAVKRGQEGPYAKSTSTDGYRYQPQWGYGEASGQVGTLVGDAWRAAMRAIYTQAYQATTVGGHLVTVTKDTRHNHQRRCIAVLTTEDALAAGWVGPVAWFRAEGASRTVMARMLNRRYYERGRPDLIINTEDVLVFERA